MIRLLGSFAIVGSTGHPLALPTRKARALVAVLAYHLGTPVSRERIADMLWGLSGEQHARASLRQTLSSVRKALAPDAEMLVSEGDALRLDPDCVDVDLAALRALMAAGGAERLGEAAAFAGGNLLEGIDLREDGYEAWIEAERPRVRELQASAIRQRLEQARSANDHFAAIELGRRLLEIDPFDEAAHRDLMRLFATAGRRTEALRHFERVREMLWQELATKPTPETTALADGLRRVVDQEERTGKPRTASEPSTETDEPASPEAPAWAEGGVRQVAVMCARFALRDAGAGDEAIEVLYRLTEPLLAQAEATVREFGGESQRQPGTRLVALFGIPVSHGNDVERAVRAALALSSPSGPANSLREVLVSCGVATGRVVAAAPTNGEHDVSRVAGEPVSQAINLAELAEPGAVIVTEAVRHWLEVGLELDRLPVETPHDEPLWRIRNFRAASPDAPRSPIVGRESELRQVEGMLQQCAAEGTGATVLIRGEPGIGKTRLVEELDRIGRASGLAHYAAHVLDFGAEQGRSAIAMLVTALLGEPWPQARDVPEDSLTEAPIAENQLPFLYDLLGLAQPPGMRALYHAMDNAARRQGVAQVLGELVAARAAEAPLVVSIEDIHWADRVTVDLLGALARGSRDHPMVLVMTARAAGSPIDQAWRTAARGARIVTLDLARLRDSDARGIARSYPNLDAELVSRCVERAEGNPLFLEQLLKNIREGGAEAIPASIQSLVQAQLDALRPDARYAIQAAATLGQRFESDALGYLLQDSPVRPDVLERSVLVIPDVRGFAFAHALIRDATYASLLGETRRQLHQRAASWFADRDALLHAEHLDLAKDAAAPRAYLDAARQQVGSFRLEPALQTATRGIEIATAPEDRAALLRLKGEVLLDMGEIRESIDSYRESVEAAQEDAERCRGLIGIAEGMRVSDEIETALDLLDRAQRLAEAEDLRAQLARVHYLRGSLFFPLGRVELCLEAQLEALACAKAAADPKIEAQVLSGLGDAYYALGRMATAKETYTRCVEVADALGLGRLPLANLSQIGSIKKLMLDLDGGLADCRRAEEMARQAGADRAELNAHHSSAEILLARGETTAVLRHVERVDYLVEKLGAKRFAARALHYRAKALLAAGDREQALALLERARVLSLANSPGYVGPLVCAAIALATSDPARGQEALAEGRRLLDDGAVFHNVIEYHQDAAEALLESGCWSEAERHAAALEAAMRQEPVPYTDFVIERARALAAYGRGERDAATRQGLERLRDRATRVGFHTALPALEVALGSW